MVRDAKLDRSIRVYTETYFVTGVLITCAFDSETRCCSFQLFLFFWRGITIRDINFERGLLLDIFPMGVDLNQ